MAYHENYFAQRKIGLALTHISSLLSRYSAFALGLALGALVFFLPLNAKIHENKQIHGDAYGQALADTTARESVEALFRNDLVSLRAIAQATANNPFVVRVSLRSVEQETLVQAGPLLHELPSDARTFESSITLHDSIAGAVTVTINTGSSGINMYRYLFTFIVLGAALIVLWQARTYKPFKNILSPKHSDEEVIHDENFVSDEEYDALNDNVENDEELNNSVHAYLALCVKNVAVLEHQLNGKTFRHTFKQLEKRLHQVGKLYGLKHCHWLNDRYLLSFSATDQEAALFSAACSGRLMLDLVGIINRVPLDLAAQISLDESSLTEVQMPFVGLAIEGQVQDQLSGKVEYLTLDESDGRSLISNFAQPYAELLKNQINQFQPSSIRD